MTFGDDIGAAILKWTSRFGRKSPTNPSVQPSPPKPSQPQKLSYDAIINALSPVINASFKEKKNPFTLPEFPPGVAPSKGMAMDDISGPIAGPFAWGRAAFESLIQEGEAFLGYTVLSEMALRPEYRQICATISEEMTRKWIKFSTKMEGKKDNRISDIKDEIERLKIREHFKIAAEQDGLFGRSHLYIDTGDADNPKELATPIGSGRGDASKSKIKKGSFKRLHPIEPVWVYPLNYNANNPLDENWYKPQSWNVFGKEIHHTRILTFISHPVPDILKPAFAFGGLSRTQMARPYVQNWLRTRQSISDLIHSFSVWIMKMDLPLLSGSGGTKSLERLKDFVLLRDNKGLAVVNKETEDLANVSVPLSGLPELLGKSQEQICGISRIPVVKYLGIQPSGLNASSQGELTVWYDYIKSQQEFIFRQNLQTVIDFIQLSKFGEVNEDIVFEFESLEEMSPLDKANIEKIKAETDQIYIQEGTIAPLEIRQRLASAEDSEYASIDVDELPEPLGMMNQPDQPNGEALGPQGFADAQE
jgi:uncharacterized protein